MQINKREKQTIHKGLVVILNNRIKINSIQSRLTAIFILGLLIMTSLSGYIIIKYEDLITDNAILTKKTHEIQSSAFKSQIFFKTQVQEWKNILLRGYDNNLYEKYLKSFTASEGKVIKEVNRLLYLSIGYPELKKDAKKFIIEHKKLGARYREALPVFKLAEHDPHITTDKYVRGIDRQPIKLLSHIVDNTLEIYRIASHKRQLDFDNLKYSVALVFIVTLVFLVIIFWIFTRKGITQPLTNITSLLKNIAEGDRDLTRRLDTYNVAELKNMSKWFNVFIENIQQLMIQVNTAANNLSKASYESAKTNERTNQAITSQQTAISHVSNSMQQMTVDIQTVADNAQLTAESTKSALSSTSTGYDVVVKAVSEINLLSNKINNSTDIVRQLADESAEVNTILNAITAIAEQTNLLALNAAIEAARAGEHGRGFAVVADEVRGLSQKTYQATVQIQQLVQNIQDSSKKAVTTMLDSREQAVKTVELANHAGTSLEKINSTLSKIDTMNKDIADSCISQSESANEINATIININNSISSTIGDAQKNTSDSSDLAQLASLLHMLITQFKVTDKPTEASSVLAHQKEDIELF